MLCLRPSSQFALSPIGCYQSHDFMNPETLSSHLLFSEIQTFLCITSWVRCWIHISNLICPMQNIWVQLLLLPCPHKPLFLIPGNVTIHPVARSTPCGYPWFCFSFPPTSDLSANPPSASTKLYRTSCNFSPCIEWLQPQPQAPWLAATIS